ncbi:MAG: YoaK family protein [Novosphingobium sp.]
MKDFDRPRQALAIGLAALAGFVDAFGFLSADGFFVSFMSGNTTRLAVNLSTDPWLAVMPALLLFGFVVGVATGAIVAEKSGPRRKPATLLLVSALLACAALFRTRHLDAAMLGALVIAMGALNNTFRRNGEVAVGLTYMTGALVRLGQSIAAMLMRQANPGGLATLLLWLGLASGAVMGAFAFHIMPAAATWLASAWAMAMALFSMRLRG